MVRNTKRTHSIKIFKVETIYELHYIFYTYSKTNVSLPLLCSLNNSDARFLVDVEKELLLALNLCTYCISIRRVSWTKPTAPIFIYVHKVCMLVILVIRRA